MVHINIVTLRLLFKSILFVLHRASLHNFKMSWTKRGTGTCQNCSREFSNRWKPVNCPGCGFHIGGTREVATKKSRLNQPPAVLVFETASEKLYSVNTSTRDDRCFVVQEGNIFFCSHQQCKSRRATYVSSEMTSDFVCVHTQKCKEAIAVECVHELSPEMIKAYKGDSSSKELLLSIHESRLPGCPFVCKVSDVSYVVLGLPSTNNTLGYTHVKTNKGSLVCCSKDSACVGFSAKGKYERAKSICSHLHALFCAGVGLSTQSTKPATSSLESESENVAESVTSKSVHSLQRSNTVKLRSSSRKIPLDIPPELLRQIDQRNVGVDLQWPMQFFQKQESCCLCGSQLGKAIKHPGSDGTAYLITSSVCFSKVETRIKICSNTNCKAINQDFPIEIGKFCLFCLSTILLEIKLYFLFPLHTLFCHFWYFFNVIF